jgi:hypothetical protein
MAETTEDAAGWLGTPVDDSSGKRLGKVSGLYSDAESNEPKWLVVRLGPLAGEAAIPFEHTAAGGGRVWVAYTREEVRSSHKLKGGRALTAAQELELCEHYGVDVGIGRADELAERGAGQISAVPAAA